MECVLKKGVFEFIEKQKECFAISISGGVISTVNLDSDIIEMLKKNYNIFPTYEMCEKASSFGLDERKQLLFANMKGYLILTREEAMMMYGKLISTYSLIYEGFGKEYIVDNSRGSHIFSSNVHFLKKQNAKECASFINSEVVE